MRRVVGLILSALAASLPLGGAAGQSGDGSFTSAVHFQERDGPAIYRHVCQSCHMPGGKGAVGAGAYPALAGNTRLEAAGYPVLVVLNGLHGMPGFAAVMDDTQIAAIVNYVRSNFGNHYGTDVTEGDVRAARK